MNTTPLTVAEALHQAALIDLTLDAYVKTAPMYVEALGGRDALPSLCEMTCIGPILRLDAAAWESMSREFQDRRNGWA